MPFEILCLHDKMAEQDIAIGHMGDQSIRVQRDSSSNNQCFGFIIALIKKNSNRFPLQGALKKQELGLMCILLSPQSLGQCIEHKHSINTWIM